MDNNLFEEISKYDESIIGAAAIGLGIGTAISFIIKLITHPDLIDSIKQDFRYKKLGKLALKILEEKNVEGLSAFDAAKYVLKTMKEEYPEEYDKLIKKSDETAEKCGWTKPRFEIENVATKNGYDTPSGLSRKAAIDKFGLNKSGKMNKNLFEAVYRESTIGMSEVTTEKDLRALLDAGCNVYAHGTGGFGEDSEAKVIAIGKVADLKDEISTDLTEEGYDSFEDWFEDNKDNEVVILDQTVGQMNYNYYDLGSYSVEDCNLWASAADIEKYCNGEEASSGNGVIGTWGSHPLPNGYKGPCPNCGGKVFGYAKLPMNIMHGAEYNICRKCGAMYPYEPWKEGENHD